mmetsp:Transcript_26257/g.63979  ORF Transcript_26257/g.63979 Transcript_26257/m.63979 type:complete len:291 (-) Transcript_26257:125-997(-)
MADEAKEDDLEVSHVELGDEAADVEAQESKPADAAEEAPTPAAEEAATPAAEGEEKPEGEKEISLVTTAVLTICGAMVGLYLVSIVLSGYGLFVFLAWVVSIIVGCLVAKAQYFDLESLETLRTVHNRLRAHVNDFSAENDKLVANNDRLEQEIAPLKESEEKLSQIAEQNGSDVKKLTGLVSENQKTLDEMHEIQRQDVTQSLMQILMDVDRDEDGELTDRECKRLMNKMKNLPTVDLNEDLFEKKLENHRRVSTFIDMVGQVHNEDIPEDQRIFAVNEDVDPEAAMEE